MKRDKNLIIKILFIGLGLLLILYFTFTRQTEKRYQWSETYSVTSDQPYGTLFIEKLLEGYRPQQALTLNDKKPVHIVLDSAATKVKTDFVFIGHDIFLDEEDANALLAFISAGNDAFIATVNLPTLLTDEIFVRECDEALYTEQNELLKTTHNFYNKKLKTKNGYTYSYRFGKKDVSYFWNSVSPDDFCDSTKMIVPLGYLEPNKVNFFRLSYGKGNLYIHTNPLMFTNYFMTDTTKVEYASRVFSYLSGEAIIWDEFSKSEYASKNNAPEVNPISYIMQHDSLRYAWWLMLLSAIVYTVFTAKRKQRKIAVREIKNNTSLEFVQMISALHFENHNHQDIARKKMKYFFYFIKTEYAIHTQTLTEAHVKRLADKTRMPIEEVQLIANEFSYAERHTDYSAAMLMNLFNALDKFYTHCKTQTTKLWKTR